MWLQTTEAPPFLAACFLNAQEACVLRATLTDLGHSQPPTPIQTDNQCAAGILNCTVKQKRSKAIDMRFYWLQVRPHQTATVHSKLGPRHPEYGGLLYKTPSSSTPHWHPPLLLTSSITNKYSWRGCVKTTGHGVKCEHLKYGLNHRLLCGIKTHIK